MQIPSPVRPLDWAVLIYSSASPDIEQAAVRSLEEVAAAHAPDSVAIGVQFGTRDAVVRYSPSDPAGWETLPPTDMARGDTLRDFLQWGMRKFPARHTMVVLGGHGSGWLGAVTDAARTHMISPQEVVRALDAAPARADVVVMNACLMAQAEVATELGGHADWLVVSQGMEEMEGLPLGALLEHLQDAEPRDAGRTLVAEASQVPHRTPHVSLLDLSAVPPLTRALDTLGAAILAHPQCLPCVREHIASLPTFRTGGRYDPPLSDFKDLVALARSLETDPRLDGTALPAAAEAARHATEAMVVAHTPGGGRPDAHGLSVYSPLTPLETSAGSLGARAWEAYRHLDLAHRTRWDEALCLITGQAPAPPPPATPPAG